MDKWEYRTLYIFYKNDLKDAKGKKYSTWVVQWNDGSQTEGLDIILDNEGKAGWELVNLVVEYSMGVGSYGGGANTTAYRAIFKRKMVEPTA